MREKQAGVSRRAFLTIAGSAAALGLSGVWLAGRALDVVYPPAQGRHLSGRAVAVWQRLMALWLPQADARFPAPDSLPVLEEIDGALGRLAAPLREQVLEATAAFEVAALVYGWHGAPFSQLPDAEAQSYLRRWADGLPAQRALLAAFRQIVHLSYWRHPETWPATGYRGPLHQYADLPRLGDAPEPTRA